MRRGNGFIGSFGAAIVTAGLAIGLCLAWSADAQPQRGEWLEVTTEWDGDTWHVDSPHGYEIIGFDSSWDWPNFPHWQKEAAFDGDFGNFAHPESGDIPVWVGLDLGEGVRKEITGVRYAPRDGFEERGLGATIKGANEPDLSDAVVLYTNEQERPSGEWTTFEIDHPEGFRFVFYEGDPAAGTTEVAALEFYGLTPVVEVAPRRHVVVAPGGQTELGPVLIHEDYEADATFEWFFEGELLEGETGAGLMIDDATVEQDGTYTVVVRHPDFEDPVAEFDIVVRVFEAQAPVAGVLGLGVLAGALALLGGMRRTRK